MIKYRLHEVAKDLGLQSKDLMDFLAPRMELDKKHMTVLDEPTMNLVYDHFTRLYAVESYELSLPTSGSAAVGSAPSGASAPAAPNIDATRMPSELTANAVRNISAMAAKPSAVADW